MVSWPFTFHLMTNESYFRNWPTLVMMLSICETGLMPLWNRPELPMSP